MSHRPITVTEMITFLSRVPGDTPVEFYGNDGVHAFHSPLTSHDLVYSEDRQAVVLQADWR
jgi:hypothetical protein